MVKGGGYGGGVLGSEEENNVREDNYGGLRRSFWYCSMC